jgi:two-component system response regulator AtoC
MDGLDVLQELKRKNGKTGTIMITAFHDMDTTIKAMKLGASEYITKPIDVEELEKAIGRALKVARSVREADTIFLDHSSGYEQGMIVGKGKLMKEIFKIIGMLSENRVTVLIEGETGTGKELIARAIHYHSPYKDNPFLAINCSTIVGALLESELFGHERGAFTGALFTKKGKFELAGAGTIFLDEVSEIPFELQAKLLRFLQEKEFERVGGEKRLKSGARVIAATNRDLWQMVKDGQFREDLYYRLSVATMKVPPLRERKSDIPLLVEYIVKKMNWELHRNIRMVEEKAMAWMMEHHWPGNVRELENVLTRAAIASQGETIEESIVTLLGKHEEKGPPGRNSFQALSLQEMEKEHIVKVLNHTGWHLGKTCELLGISRPTLRQKVREYGISRAQ